MKTKSKDAIDRLTEAVIEQLGYEMPMSQECLDTLKDVVGHGASGGFSGFCYSSETCAFYEANREEIWDLLYDDAKDIGSKNILELIAGFSGAKDVGSTDQFESLLAWYALETVAQHMTEGE